LSAPVKPLAVGAKVGRLTVLAEPVMLGRYRKVSVQCDCGTTFFGDHDNIRREKTRSCGCLNREKLKERATHGKTHTPLFRIWATMRQRCENPNNKQYQDYGGRGIKVCERWSSFENFYEDMGDPPFAGASLDREENSQGYSKENCRWVTRKVQNNNKRNVQLYSFQGQQLTLSSIADALGLPYQTLYSRLFLYGWSEERAFSRNGS
jgi:hypothetical protein